eukprot:3497775-Prymnesium_polylepis.2
MLYNQALVGGLSNSFDPAPRIGNVSLNGGSKYKELRLCTTTSARYPTGCFQKLRWLAGLSE